MSTTVEASILNQIQDPKSTQGVFDLPCGFLDAQGQLHSDVVVRELTGEEEDLLGSRQMGPFQKYNELLVRCTTRIGSITGRSEIANAVRNLPIGDRIFILMALRRVSIGDEYALEVECDNPECKSKRTYTVSLADLTVKKMPEPNRRLYDVTLPSGATARFRISTGLDEERAMRMDKAEDALSKAMLMRLELLNGAPPQLADVKAMKWKDRRALRDAWDKVEGGIDTSIEIQCSDCGKEFKREVQIDSNFFFPSDTSNP